MRREPRPPARAQQSYSHVTTSLPGAPVGCCILRGMAIRTALTLRLENTLGALDRVCQALARENANIIGMSLEGTGVLLLVADNPVHVAGLLRNRDYIVEEREVLYVTVSNGPGGVSAAARLLSQAGVNIEYAFATAGSEQEMAALVVVVEDAQRAAAAAGM